MKLWLDLETYSEAPITNGTHVYAAAAQAHALPVEAVAECLNEEMA